MSDFSFINDEVIDNAAAKDKYSGDKKEGHMDNRSFYDKYSHKDSCWDNKSRPYAPLLGGVSSRTSYIGSPSYQNYPAGRAEGNIGRMFNRILKNMFDTNINKTISVKVAKKVPVKKAKAAPDFWDKLIRDDEEW